MMVTSRVLDFWFIRSLFGDLLEQGLELAARPVDFLGELPLVALECGQLLAQPPVFVAQPLAQPGRLLYFFLEGRQFGVHRHTIVWKILLSQGVSLRSQCRFQARYRTDIKDLCCTINALVRGVPVRFPRRGETGKRCGARFSRAKASAAPATVSACGRIHPATAG